MAAGARRICVLIVVDTVGALANGTLLNNCYMVDTNEYLGSWQEATDELHTVCQDGQPIVWNTAPVSPDRQVEISAFSGPMVTEAVCAPSREGDGSWAGLVAARGAFAAYPYTATLSMEGTDMQATCYLKVV